LPLKDFFITLSTYDRIRVRITVQYGEPVEIMVQLESFIMDRWREVRRYDTAHGYLHVHSAPWDDAQDRRMRVQHAGLRSALTTAIDEIKTHWPRYRQECETGLGGAS